MTINPVGSAVFIVVLSVAFLLGGVRGIAYGVIGYMALLGLIFGLARLLR